MLDQEVNRRIRRALLMVMSMPLEHKIAALAPDADLKDTLHFDSMDAVSLAMALEKEFGIKVPDKDFENFFTILSIAEYLTKRKGSETPKTVFLKAG